MSDTPDSSELSDFDIVASGLQFPEGPIAMADGSVVFCEIAGGTLTRVNPDGSTEVVAECGGGPNGAAIGADGAIYVANNGGYFTWTQVGEFTVPGLDVPDSWTNGSIQRVDPLTGSVEVIATECEGNKLHAPNDLVVDRDGGIWFTDHGVKDELATTQAGVLYLTPKGTVIPVIRHTEAANGIGLSPEGDRLYVAETHTGRVWAWDVVGPGQVGVDPDSTALHGGTLLFDAPEGHLFDSLAVDGQGWVCVGTLGQGGITCISPDGAMSEHLPFPDPLITNICFGGSDLRTAYVTSSGVGNLLAFPWHRAGLALSFP
ncbi:MAG: SMP-30/gluconolactonase/LRE family protein [Actinomycetes bacterium]